MDERNEDVALRGILPLIIGGKAVELRTLTLDESDEWLGRLAEELAAVGIEDTDQGADLLRAVYTASSAAVARLVVAYDVDGKLGGLEALRSRATKVELKQALDRMVGAEDPFGEAAAHSAAEGFGAASTLLAQGMRAVVAEQMWSALADSTTGPSNGTASDTARSVPVGARSNSSSGGTTPRRHKRSG